MTQATTNNTLAPVRSATPVVGIIGSAALADSRDVAAFFKRAHKNVLQGLRNTEATCSPEFARLNFQPVYLDGHCRQVISHYLMTKDGFAFAVLGFTGADAARFKEAYIGEFNRMAEELRRRQAPALDVRDASQLQAITLQLIALTQEQAAELAGARQALVVVEAVVEQQRPMVEAYEAFLDDRGLCNLRTAARAIDAPSDLFFDWIKDKGYVVRENGDLQPSAAMRRDRYMLLRAGPVGAGKLRNQAMVTRSGLAWLRQRWAVGPGKVIALQAALAERQGRLAV